MDGEDNDLRSRSTRPELAGDRDAIQFGHREVQHDHIRIEVGDGLQRRLAITGCSRHLELRGQQTLRSSEERLVIVCQDQARSAGIPALGRR